MSFVLPTDIVHRPVTVIGAGTLGRRIALMLATRGGQVRIYDLSAPQRAAATDFVARNLAHVVATVKDGTPGTVTGTGDLQEALENSWLVIEAIPERLAIKKQLFEELDRLACPDAILASNSSSYASSQLIDNVTRPERVLNVHFYMPPVQNAIDLMSDGYTDRAVIDLLLQELPRYGVFPFEARKESTGFIFNRVWAAIKRECLDVVSEGVTTPAELDRMFEINSNLPSGTGPFRGMDQVGLDVVLDIENHYAAENPNLPHGPRVLLHHYVDAGKLGVKTGEGFYTYPSAAHNRP
jgi:3-hydroxybutyryl-CoA dehydrogenase